MPIASPQAARLHRGRESWSDGATVRGASAHFQAARGLLLVPLRSGDARECRSAPLRLLGERMTKQCRYASPPHPCVELRYETHARAPGKRRRCLPVCDGRRVCVCVCVIDGGWVYRCVGQGERACVCDDVRFGINCLLARRASCASRVLRTKCIGVHTSFVTQISSEAHALLPPRTPHHTTIIAAELQQRIPKRLPLAPR